MPLGLFEKPPRLTVTLDRPGGPYYPGDTITVSISIAADKPAKVREVRASLLLRQKYKMRVEQEDAQTKEKKIVEQESSQEQTMDKQVPIQEGTLQGGQTVTATLRIPPDAVAPYSSTLIETKWLVKVTVDRPLASDADAEIDLLLVAAAPGLRTATGDYGTTSNVGDATPRFTLPTLEVVTGDTLRGELVITPHKPFEAREVRLELLWQEGVTEGKEPNTHEAVDQKMQLAGGTRFTSGEPVTYDFVLLIHSKGHPTVQTARYYSRWLLKATIDRALALDPEVQQELFVYNGARPG